MGQVYVFDQSTHKYCTELRVNTVGSVTVWGQLRRSDYDGMGPACRRKMLKAGKGKRCEAYSCTVLHGAGLHLTYVSYPTSTLARIISYERR